MLPYKDNKLFIVRSIASKRQCVRSHMKQPYDTRRNIWGPSSNRHYMKQKYNNRILEKYYTQYFKYNIQ